MKFIFIHAEKAHFPIAAMCRVFAVTRQGYYAFSNRPPSARVRAEEVLATEVQLIFDENRRVYGVPRVLKALRDKGRLIGKARVARTMRGMGLTPKPRRRHVVTTTANPAHAPAPNTLARDFAATRPNERWVTDITYVHTMQGWAYCAVILDLFSRAVVGWAVDTSLSTRLAMQALQMAVRRRRPAPGLLHHSDRGCQYTSAEYNAELKKLGIDVSMSRRGNCWDNAVAESFFATLKSELVRHQTWGDAAELRAAVFEYVEVFYNRRRLHSTLGYRTPAAVEAEYKQAA
jgi:putative transposase